MSKSRVFEPFWQGGELGKRLLLAVIAVALLVGAAVWLAGRPDFSAASWAAGTAVILASLLTEIAISLGKREFGLDLIAALAMGGALLLGEYLTGSIVALMYTGGEALEDFAQRRARRELTALLNRVPRTAARYADGQLQEVSIEELGPGDRILVRRGEVVPVDGNVRDGIAVLDESALTGEAMPVRRSSGEPVTSGTTNTGDAFEMVASNAASDSTYAAIVRLVVAAKAAKAPIVRLADRYAVVFLAVTLLLAGGAWVASGQAIRALAVLVIATPCPLILAVPVAIISGVSRCAGKGVLVKGGGALETLARMKTVILDKTGTITDGRARLVEVKSRADLDPMEALRLAASLDQGSHHVIARALVAAARERGLKLVAPSGPREVAGSGVAGSIDGHEIAVGGWDFVSDRIDETAFSREIREWIRRDGTVSVLAAQDGVLAGAFLLADEVRPEAGSVLRQLRAAGVDRLVLATGDRTELAEGLQSFLGLDSVVAELKPEDKTRIVEAERSAGPVMMVGDGVNDAPALAAADVGVAMGARGAAASSEAADVVILVDRLDRLVSAIRIAHRSRGIALQSVYVGMGLSLAGMTAAAFGYLTPVQGALLQEAIDVVAILNALRALGDPFGGWRKTKSLPHSELLELEAEHCALIDVVDEIRHTTERIQHLPDEEVRKRLADLDALLRQRLLPHERQDDEELYPRLRRRAGTPDAFAGMSRTHMEIQRRVHSLTSLRKALGEHGPSPAQRYEIQRLLHGLEAITRLHFAQEQEIYRLLEDEQ
ncbi:heavy metal translocating P-type ATPase [Sinorhizobium americanum]|uniref:P-type Zn(2+) transporter n=1 Tax=Sinorhizobium americanum TaxID=194963 RepID=A0A4R2B651_9HYPH|nr:heavy metal translocating P-type ATPase [Sinorhizobium americanum]TCN21302.1 heavy metal-(Cd/Co/Hg/Pb/Zn)-translocating P-type ATPase [Sinorhizobium americanum]